MIRLFLNSIFSFFLITTISCAQSSPPDSVTITFKIVAPEDTPKTDTIFWAGDLNSWDPGDNGIGFSPKDQAKPALHHGNHWQLKITAQTDSETDYKYTRGSIFSVEESPDYTYKETRKVTFDTNKTIIDTVSTWHDLPPKELSDKWPKIDLNPTELKITFNGQIISTIPRGNAVLFAEDKAQVVYNFSNADYKIQSVPTALKDPLFYYLKISSTPNNFIGIVAGKTDSSEIKNIYVDRNNDKVITMDEQIFSIESEDHNKWTGKIFYNKRQGDDLIQDSVSLSIFKAENLPSGYGSSNNAEVPNISYTLPYKHRKGVMNKTRFYLTADFNTNFKNFLFLSVDRNNDGNIAIESGSDEITSIDYQLMRLQNQYYIPPQIKIGNNNWEVANIDTQGNWIRFRPLTLNATKKKILKGEKAPNWEGKTISGKKLGSKSLKGKYVLFDFWGSWCGPCIDAIPELKEVYQQFNGDKFEIVGFAYENNSSLQKALKKYQLSWPQVLDDKGKFKNLFSVQGYPTYYLIDPDGNIIATDQELEGGQMIKTIQQHIQH